jgi:hypothetical protein
MFTMTRVRPDGEWIPTVDYKMEGGKLMRLWVRTVWPHEPHREKGEEIVYEEWREVV